VEPVYTWIVFAQCRCGAPRVAPVVPDVSSDVDRRLREEKEKAEIAAALYEKVRGPSSGRERCTCRASDREHIRSRAVPLASHPARC
jgi:hypothetical protein